MLMLGNALTVTVQVDGALTQPFAPVPVTVYAVVAPGVAVTLLLLTPPLLSVAEGVQVYEVPPLPVNAADCPTHIVPLVLLIVGSGRTVTVEVPVFLHPFASVTVTV